MKWSTPILSIVVPLCACTVVGGMIKTSAMCSNSSYYPVHLTCGSYQRIHVVSIIYQKTNKACAVQDDACQVIHNSRSDGFFTACNGLTSCWETVQGYWITAECEETSHFKVSISYECVSDSSIIDICNSITASSETSLVYMVSPNFYNPVSLGPGRSCVCKVTGEKMKVEILGLYFMQRNGVRANLTLKTDSATWSPEQHKYRVNNWIILQDKKSIDVTFDTNGMYGQIMWIRIRGSSEIRVTCNEGTNNTVHLPPEPIHPLDVDTAPVTEKEETRVASLTIVAVTCGVIIVLMLVIIVALLVWLKVQRSRRSFTTYGFTVNRHNPSDVSYIHVDRRPAGAEYENIDIPGEDGSQQIPKLGDHLYRNSSDYSQINEPMPFVSETEDDTPQIDGHCVNRNVSIHAYQRD